MIKLEPSKMKKAIERAKAIHPRVTRLAERSYRVTSSNGQDSYTVHFKVVGGHKLAECDCKAGRAGMICFHVAAAGAINIALHSRYSRPSKPATAPRAKMEGILIKTRPAGFQLDGWDL
jgi:hypothetical protein